MSTATVEAPVWFRKSEPLGSGLTLGMVREVRADHMVPGLFVPNQLRGSDGLYHDLAPAKVVAVEPHPQVGGMLLITFDNGVDLPFERDEIMTMQCLLAPEPVWCRDHSVESDGTVRHCGAEESLTFTDPESGGYTILASATRYDDPDGTIDSGPSVTVSVLGTSGMVSGGIDFELSPQMTREMAAMMTRVAASVDNEPHMVDVESIRVNDEVMTPDGWQKVTTVMADGLCREVAVYTVSDDQDALRLPLGTLVEIRRGGAR